MPFHRALGQALIPSRCLLGIVLSVLSVPTTSSATTPMLALEKAPFSAEVSVLTPIRLRTPFRVQLKAQVWGPRGARCRINVSLPSFVKLDSGDTACTSLPQAGKSWVLTVTPVKAGQGEVWLRMQVQADSADASYVCEAAADLTVRSDTGFAGPSRIVRSEILRANRRFRYGGEILEEVDGQGRRVLYPTPVILHSESAICPVCEDLPRKVFVWVMLNAAGRQTGQIEIHDMKMPRDRGIGEAVFESLRRWQFEPGEVPRGAEYRGPFEVQVEVVRPE